VTSARPPDPAEERRPRAISFDFGNTLVHVRREAARRVIQRTADAVVGELGVGTAEQFAAHWVEERDRQFREELPEGREVDVEQRAVRILARLRGVAPPAAADRWDDAAIAGHATAREVEVVVEAYSTAFLAEMPPAADSSAVLRELSDRGFRLAILSNWPLAVTIDRFVDAAGWAPLLAATFVSQRIGAIKPQRRIFDVAASDLGVPPSEILHVGDDWAADVVGARAAGWRAAYLRDHQGDTPLPTSTRDAGVTADLELERLGELPSRLADPPP
jgi:putative hydrolase of the HAD superfamily